MRRTAVISDSIAASLAMWLIPSCCIINLRIASIYHLAGIIDEIHCSAIGRVQAVLCVPCEAGDGLDQY